MRPPSSRRFPSFPLCTIEPGCRDNLMSGQREGGEEECPYATSAATIPSKCTLRSQQLFVPRYWYLPLPGQDGAGGRMMVRYYEPLYIGRATVRIFPAPETGMHEKRSFLAG